MARGKQVDITIPVIATKCRNLVWIVINKSTAFQFSSRMYYRNAGSIRRKQRISILKSRDMNSIRLRQRDCAIRINEETERWCVGKVARIKVTIRNAASCNLTSFNRRLLCAIIEHDSRYSSVSTKRRYNSD